MKTNKKLIINTLISISIITWLCSGIYPIYKNNPGFNIIAEQWDHNNLTGHKNSEILNGEKIVGKFTANNDYLGIVAVRFFNNNRINDDSVIFRIKEEGQDWFYENTYKTDQFQPNDLFPFGFPILPHSNGKTYIFEIESVGGIPGNAISLSEKNPVFESRYQIPINIITENYKNATIFILKKAIYLLKIPTTQAYFVIYLVPSIFLLATTIYIKSSKLKQNTHAITISLVTLIIFSSIFGGDHHYLNYSLWIIWSIHTILSSDVKPHVHLFLLCFMWIENFLYNQINYHSKASYINGWALLIIYSYIFHSLFNKGLNINKNLKYLKAIQKHY